MIAQGKHLKFLFLLLVLLTGEVPSEAFSFFKVPSDSFQFQGRISNDDANVLGVYVNVYLDNIEVTNASSNRFGNFHVFLHHNKTYTFEFSKQGFITERFQIVTTIPDKLLKKGGIGLSYQNDFELLEYYKGVNIDIFSKTVRFFTYNPRSLLFEEDLKKSLVSEVNAVKSSINEIKNKLAANELKVADNFFKQQKYKEALISYNWVLECTPLMPARAFSSDWITTDNTSGLTATNNDVMNKLKEARRLFKENPEFENDYKAIVKKADGSFKLKVYADAKENYKIAGCMKPEDAYISNQLLLIDSFMSVGYIANKKEYEKIIAVADQKFKDNQYYDAQKEYGLALALQVDTIYPQQKIDIIRTAIAAEKKKKDNEARVNNEKYDSLIKNGEEYISKADYLNALEMFKQALEVKPSDNYATIQKNKTEKLLIETYLENIKKQREAGYTDTLALADKAFRDKDYKQALILYAAALAIKPSENYISQKISEIINLQNVAHVEISTQVIQETEIENEPVAKQLSGKELDKEIDSLMLSASDLEQQGNKAEASRLYIRIAKMFRKSAQPEKALQYLKKALALLKQLGDKAGESNVLVDMASDFYDSGLYNQTILSYKQALALKKELGDSTGQAEIFSEMGVVMVNTYQYETAADALLKALAINQQLGNQQAILEVTNKLGGIYYNQGDYQKSLYYFNRALKIATLLNNKNSLEELLNSLGVVYYKLGKYDEAIKYYNQSIALDNETGNKKNLALSYNNIGNVNFNWNKYDKAIEFYQRSLSLKKELNFEQGMAASMYNIGNSYLELKQYSKAKQFLNAGADLAKKVKFTEVMQLSYKALSKLYETTKDFQNATYSYKSFVSVAGPVMISEGQISEMNEMYERESKLIKTLRHDLERQKFLTDYAVLQTTQKQKEIRIKDVELKNQKAKALTQQILLIFCIIFLIFAGALALQYFLRYQQKKRYSEVIGFQKQQITDSITYASRIQKAVFIPGEQMKSVFPESFILNRPKDVVSGDYFYMANRDNKIYVAVADCTGHGVPGAFMSMLGISLIKEVLLLEKTLSANEVLNELRDALMKALHQTGRADEAKDGMDIALCVIDFVNMRLEYSGANNPCFIIRNKQLIELKADRMPIGIHPILKPFTSKDTELEKDDMIYLFSDGFSDQIGQENHKKFRLNQFSNLLINISSESIEKQPLILDDTIDRWRGNIEQTDDILIVGIKI